MAKITNFLEEITDIVGTIPSTISDSGEKIFDEGIYDVINRIAVINPRMLDLFAAESEFIADEGHSLNNIKIIDVTAGDGTDDINCRIVSSRLKTKVQKGSDSIYEATLNSPCYYIINGKIYTSPEHDFEVTISAETIDTSFESGAIYTAKGSAVAVGDVFKVTDDTDLTSDVLKTAKGGVAPADGDYFIVTSITTPAVSYINSSKISEVVKGTVTNYSTGATTISSYPDFLYHLPILFTAMRLLSETIRGYSFSALSNIPASPSCSTLSSVTSNLPTFIAPTAPSAPADVAAADVDFTDVPTAPSFIKPVLALSSIPIIADLTISVDPITLPDAPSITSPGISAVTAAVISGNTPSYIKPTKTFDIAQLETFLETNEDTELAQVQIARLQNEAAQYQLEIQNELNDFNKDNAIYQASVMSVIKKFEADVSVAEKEGNMTLTASIQDYQSTLGRFQADIQRYQAVVNDEVSEYSATLKKEIDLYNSESQALLSQYTSDIQNEMAQTNSELEEYKTEINKAIQTYISETGYDLSNYTAKLNASITVHKETLNSAVASFQKEVQAYSLDNAQASARNGEILSRYQINSNIFQFELQRVLQQYSSELQKDALSIKNIESSYIKIKTEYEQAFVPFQIPSQSEVQSGR